MAQNLLLKTSLTSKDCQKNTTRNLVESIKNYIYENECPKITMDISNLNVIDASKVALICSTYHYAKYPHGEISWKVASTEIKNIIKPLNLGNIRLIT